MAKGSTKARTTGDGLGGAEPATLPKAAPVAGTKILLRRSGVQGKLPTAGDAEYGELFINYHSGDPMLCFKDNSDNIVEIKPPRAIDGGGGEVPPDTGNTVGDLVWDGTHLLVWDGADWLPVGPGDLAYVQKVDGGTITNSAGDDVELPLATVTYAGLIVDAASDGKQYARVNGAWAEVDIPPGTTVSEFAPAGPETGQLWYGTTSGVLSVYDGSAWQVSKVDLGYTAAADKGTVTCSVGADAELPLVSGIEAGLMAPGDKNKLDGYPATPDDLALDLQAVTDNGNTTTNLIETSGGVKVSGGNISIAGPGIVSNNTSTQLTAGYALPGGNLAIAGDGGGAVGFNFRKEFNSTETTLNHYGLQADIKLSRTISQDFMGFRFLLDSALSGAGCRNLFGINFQIQNFTGSIGGVVSAFEASANVGNVVAPNVYGFRSSLALDGGKNFNFIGASDAPNFFAGNTYIGGTTTRNTRELWESLLTEEQKEELTAGTLAIPANVETPGDGSFVRQWWYDQQSAEDQALIDAGELEYPERLQAANFADTFALGDNTKINFDSVTGLGEFRGGVKITGGSNTIGTGLHKNGSAPLTLYSSGSGVNVESKTGNVALSSVDIAHYLTVLNDGRFIMGKSSNSGYALNFNPEPTGAVNGILLAPKIPAASTASVGIDAKVDTSKVSGNLTFLRYIQSGNSNTYTGSTGDVTGYFAHRNIGIAGTNAYGFYSEIFSGTGSATNKYNFYADGNSPNFFQGDTYIGGNTTRNTRELWESTLTEEQKEELTAGTLAIPANVSTPGDGEFARQWWYDQQSAEDQALIDAGELEYPEKLQPANFVDTFDLGDKTNINLLSDGKAYFADNVGIGTRDPQAKLDVDGLIQSSGGVKVTGGATISGNTIGVNSNISSAADTYNFYAAGNAPNYFRGSVYKDMNGGGELVVAADPETYTNHDSNGISLGYSLFCTRTSATPLDINRGKTGDTTLDDSTNHQVMMIRYKGAQKATIIVGTSGAELTGFTRVANPSMDGRVLTSPTEITNATDVIKQLAPKQEGFKAEELQAIVPEAVTGTQNATEAIGTLADYDGTVIETEITEPSAEELEYTEEVETDGVATMVTRTRTWTPSGTQPVYQGVDQSKLIPLLTKALQEALERIEQLEAKLA